MAYELARGAVGWEIHPGAFDLMNIPEEQLDNQKLRFLQESDATRGLPGGPGAGGGTHPPARLIERWRRLRNRLQGFTESEVLCRDEPATISLLRLYRPPGGWA